MKTERQLTVYGRLRDAEDKSSVYPEIKLRGDWVKKAGLNIGDKITVQVHQGRLTIVKVIT